MINITKTQMDEANNNIFGETYTEEQVAEMLQLRAERANAQSTYDDGRDSDIDAAESIVYNAYLADLESCGQ